MDDHARDAVNVSLGTTIAQLRAGAAAADDTMRAAPTREFVRAPSGRMAMVLPEPRLPDSLPDATWTSVTEARLLGPTGLPQLAEVDKGKLGDCWAVAGVGSLTVPPRYQQQLADMLEETPEHVVMHLPRGESVAVTKQLPFVDGHPAFASTSWRPGSERPIWSGMVEKLLAAREPEGYQSLVGGQANWVYRVLLDARPGAAPAGSTPFLDVVRALRAGEPVAVGMMPYESVSIPGLALSVGQEGVLDGAGLVGNHYYVATAVGERDFGLRKGAPTIALRNTVEGKQPRADLMPNQFNAVVVDTDSPSAVGEYMGSGLAERSLLADAFPSTAQMDEQQRRVAAHLATFGSEG